MAKRCEICGKGPVVGRQHQPREQRQRAAVRAEPADGPGDDQRRRPAHPRLHALPAVGQGRQGGVKLARCARQSPPIAHRRRSARTRRPFAPGSCCSCSGQIPHRSRDRRRSSTATSRHRRGACSTISARSSRPAGARFADVVRTTVFLADMNDFAAMNEVYATFFTRAVSRARDRAGRRGCRKDARIEIDVIATSYETLTVRSVPADPARPGRPARPARPARSHVQHAVRPPRSDLITFSRCFRSLISTVMSIRAALVVVGARFHVLDVGVDVGDLRADAASRPFRSSTSIVSFTV